ncbi:MAG TPA: lysophospholipid acyltransferase family protein [Steroidobacteraceae bacterium]|jgi:1-acyl-sn-glycerol-3-phosphate acyltransferase|nr:lysophospholipid acyltransferase family protein [Steroidobacteraceae bacterium]
MQLLRSLFFTSFFLFFTFLYAIFFVIACLVLPYRARFALARAWGIVLLAVLRLTCRLDYRVEGRENLPAGCHVALMKHSSSWETFAQAVILPPQAWVLKRELTWIPFVGWGLRQLRAIAIDRGAGGVAVRQMIEQGRKRLADGMWIVVFPEGTRMPPGDTRRYGVGGAAIAAETGCLIVPVAHNSGYYWPRRGWLKKPGTIRVVIGKPIVAQGRDPREINEEAQRFIEAHSGP